MCHVQNRTDDVVPLHIVLYVEVFLHHDDWVMTKGEEPVDIA